MTPLYAVVTVLMMCCVDAKVPCKQPSAPGCIEPYLSSTSDQSPWPAYLRAFNKSYSNTESTLRHDIWVNNTLAMIKTNSETKSFSLGWTVHSDMTEQEFRTARLGYRQRPSLNSSTRFGLPHLGEFHFDGVLKNLPSSWDWSLAKVPTVTPVKDQGQCGSCWSFSVTGALEGALAVANGWMKSLSEQQLMDCDTQEGGCGGGSPHEALSWEKNQNVCSEASYGYRGSAGRCQASSCSAVITLRSIWGAYSVAQDSEGAACSALTQRPLSISIATGGGFMSYRGGLFDDAACGDQVDHAVLLVGYGYYNNRPYWKLKNSWGATNWGIDGYAILARGGQGSQQCAILSEVVGVYVFGPYNPKMQLRGMRGDVVVPQDKLIV